MATKVYDLAVKDGTYTDQSGQTKNRYKNIGVAMKTDDGGKFLLIDRTWNPAGSPYDEGKGNHVMVSMFEPRKPDGARETATAPAQQTRRTPEAPGAQAVRAMLEQPTFDDDIPF